MTLWVVTTLLITTHFSSAHSENWKLVWSDEFSGDTINYDLWNFEIGNGCPNLCGWGNEEKQYYTNDTENAFVKNGRLIIQAKPQKIERSDFTSVRMVTKGKGDWKYGKIEVKAKFPRGHGLLPQIWMLPSYEKYGIWPCSGHIDLATMHNAESGLEIVMTVIFGPSYRTTDSTNVVKYYKLEKNETSFTEDFHVFSLEWEEDNLQWFVNGEQVLHLNKANLHFKDEIYPFNEKFHLVLSLAVGGKVVRDPFDTKFPVRFEFDYVRVYQKL